MLTVAAEARALMVEAEARALLAATSQLLVTGLASTSSKSVGASANIYSGRFGGEIGRAHV
jgi:hypothetical protein